MPATLREVTTHATQQRTATADTPPGTKTGDHLYALHVAVGGTLAGMTEPTPGTWQLIASGTEGPESLHTKVWRSVLTSAPADDYSVQHALEGALHLAAVPGAASGAPSVEAYKSTGTAWTPALTPPSASGLEIRWAGIFASSSGGTPVWARPPGYSTPVADYTGRFAAGVLVSQAVVSTAESPELAIPHTAGDIGTVHGYTIIIPSAGGSAPGGGQIPTPPEFPAFTPLKGLTRTSYTVHDFLTGEYRGDIYPNAPTYDRRDGEAGGWTGTLPLPNRREADRIAEMIPRDPDDLTSGPGRLVVHSWRDGVLCGVHWIHTAEIAKTSRLGLNLVLQGTTLDGYMQSVSLEEDISFEADQVANLRDLIIHMGADPRSNPGLTLQPGVSGLVRPLIAAQADNTTYGRVARDYARVDGGVGYVIDPTVVDGSIERRWRWGSPRLELPEFQWTITEARAGGEITEWKEVRSALQGGTRIGSIGGVPESEDATQDRTAVRSELIETPHLAAGWPIIDLRLNHPAATTDPTELERYAARYAATAAGAPRVFSATVILGKGSEFDPNSIGGWVEYVMANDWHIRTAQGGAFEMPPQRLIGWALTPRGRGSGKDKLQLITAQDGVVTP